MSLLILFNETGGVTPPPVIAGVPPIIISDVYAPQNSFRSVSLVDASALSVSDVYLPSVPVKVVSSYLNCPTIVLNQTLKANLSGAISACSGATVSSAPAFNVATFNGTPGGFDSWHTDALAVNKACVMWETAAGEPGSTSWDAGNWVVPLNVINGNPAVTWTGTYICRIDANGNTLATVGSLTGQSISLNVTNTLLSMTIPGSFQDASLTDRIYIVLTFSNSGAGFGGVLIKCDQQITTPICQAPSSATLLSDVYQSAFFIKGVQNTTP